MADAWNLKAKTVQQQIKDVLPMALELSRLPSNSTRLQPLNNEIGDRMRQSKVEIDALEQQLSDFESSHRYSGDQLRRMEDLLVALHKSIHDVEMRIDPSSALPKPIIKRAAQLNIDHENNKAVDEAVGGHLQVIEQQDQHLDQLHAVIVNQKNIGYAISEELDGQAILMDRLDDGVDGTHERISTARRRLETLYQRSKERGSICCILILILVVILLIAL